MISWTRANCFERYRFNEDSYCDICDKSNGCRKCIFHTGGGLSFHRYHSIEEAAKLYRDTFYNNEKT